MTYETRPSWVLRWGIVPEGAWYSRILREHRCGVPDLAAWANASLRDLVDDWPDHRGRPAGQATNAAIELLQATQTGSARRDPAVE